MNKNGKIFIACMCIVAVLLMANSPHLAKSSSDTDERKVRLEEAEAIVELYEIRLYNVKNKAKQDDLRLENAKAIYKTLSASSGSVSERSIADAKYNWKLLEIDSKRKDIEEAEAELKIATARRNMVRAGIWPVYPKKE